MEPFKSTPLIEILDTPQRPQYYIEEDFEEEKNKLWALHVELDIQYEVRLRKAIMCLVDKIGWPTFYEQLEKTINIWNELKGSEDSLKPIVNKWNNRDKDVTLLCFLVINLSCEQIERTFDLTNDLFDFDNKRIALQMRIIKYIAKYKSRSFELFPHALDKKDKLKDKEEWAKELDDLLCLRMNRVTNEKGNLWWENTNEEVVKVQIFYDFLREEFIEIDKLEEYVMKKKNEILNFN